MEKMTRHQRLTDSVYRVNFGISTESFISMFHQKPSRPKKGSTIDGGYNFTALNTLTPHPVYGWMKWVSILNLTQEKFNDIKYLIDESYTLSINKFNTRRNNKKE